MYFLFILLSGSSLSAARHALSRDQKGGFKLKGVTLYRRLYSRDQSEVKRSRPNFEAGQAIKQAVEASLYGLETVKASPGARWAWLMLNSQGSRPNFQCGQGVKHENLMSQDLDPGRGWEYRPLGSVTPLKLLNR